MKNASRGRTWRGECVRGIRFFLLYPHTLSAKYFNNSKEKAKEWKHVVESSPRERRGHRGFGVERVSPRDIFTRDAYPFYQICPQKWGSCVTNARVSSPRVSGQNVAGVFVWLPLIPSGVATLECACAAFLFIYYIISYNTVIYLVVFSCFLSPTMKSATSLSRVRRSR